MKVITVRQHFASTEKPTSSYWVYEQIDALKKKGIEFFVVSPQPYLPKILRNIFKIKAKSLPINDSFREIKIKRPFHFRIPNYKYYFITNHFLSVSIKNNVPSGSYLLIHAHFGNDGVASLPLKRRLKIPLITSFYGYDLGSQLSVLKSYYRKLSKDGDLFLALSQNMVEDLINIGFPKHKIRVHHLGVNIDEVRSYLINVKKNNKLTFTIGARLNENKGIQDAIMGFSLTVKKYANIELRIVGGGKYEENLRQLVCELNLNGKIIFINNLSQQNPRKILLEEFAKSDIVILTSYTTKDGSKEGTPVVLMEAQAMGKPCIATRHAGIPEVVLDNETGFLVEERDVLGISDAMIKFKENPDLIIRFGINALKHINDNFNNCKQHEKLNNIYKEFI